VLVRMTGFKNFIMRGNLVELAAAVVIGTQFSSLVKQFVSSFVNPLLSLVGGTPDFGKLVLKVGTATFTYGQFLTEALTFLISALVVYYAMVLPASRLLKLFDRNEAATTRGLSRVHDEHPGRGPAVPGVHGRDHPRHRPAAAGRSVSSATPSPLLPPPDHDGADEDGTRDDCDERPAALHHLALPDIRTRTPARRVICGSGSLRARSRGRDGYELRIDHRPDTRSEAGFR
jgi:large conductance mechanosensitive channel